jgi:Putative adhesin
MRQVNRLIWGASGLATALVLAIPGAKVLTRANVNDAPPPVSAAPVATLPAAPAGLILYSCGATVRLVAQPVHRIQVTEAGNYPPDQGIAPSVSWSMSGKQVVIGDPQCDTSFTVIVDSVTVPDGTPVTVDSEGANVNLSGTAMATVDSQGGNVIISATRGATVNSGSGVVTANGIDGPLTVDSQGGNVRVSGLTGTLDADTGGGDLTAVDLDTPSINAVSSGGNQRIEFASAPRDVILSTDGGDANLDVPGGPYALNPSTDTGVWDVRVPVDQTSSRTITVTTDGGNLLVAP